MGLSSLKDGDVRERPRPCALPSPRRNVYGAIMPVMLERWNDDKMDALDAKVDGLDTDMREMRQEMKAGFERVEDRFERMYRLMVIGILALSAAYVAGFAALVGLVATQL